MCYNELQSTETICLQTTDNTIPIQQPVKHHYLHVNNAGKIGLIDLFVLNSNFSSITAISWRG